MKIKQGNRSIGDFHTKNNSGKQVDQTNVQGETIESGKKGKRSLVPSPAQKTEVSKE